MDTFDSSPRPSKRRRTGTYATKRRTLASSSAQSVQKIQREAKAAKSNEEPRGLKQNARSIEDEQAEASNVDTVEPEDEEQGAEDKPRRSSGRRTKAIDAIAEPVTDVATNSPARAESIDQDAKEGAEDLQPDLHVPAADDEHNEEETMTLARPRSSTRIRRPSRKLELAAAESSIQAAKRRKRAAGKTQAESVSSKPVPVTASTSILSPQPKGILTPLRHGRGGTSGPRKSVAFEGTMDDDQRQVEEQLGFKDIVSSSKKSGEKRSKHFDDTEVAKPAGDQGDPLEDALEHADSPPGDGDPESDGPVLEESLNLNDIISSSQLADIPPSGNTPTHVAEDEDPHLTTIKLQILSRIIDDTRNDTLSCSPSPVPSHLQAQYAALHALLTATITSGESNSLLLLGSRGCGKSLLIRHALTDLRKTHGSDFHLVNLNGFFQTDDKLALREIWRQLGREMAVPEDETGEVSSYADTMASLLSLLSHPEELAANTDSMTLDDSKGERNVEVGNHSSKSVVFVLDEFDLFTTHPRQTLLYNLFDIAQARKAPIAVIGCSTRMDVVECLEKRVKSRFSHRWLHIPSVKSLVALEEVVRGVLCLAVHGKEALGVTKDDLDWRLKWNAYIETQVLPASTTQALMKKIFYSTKSIPELLAALYIPIASLSIPAEKETGVDDRAQSHDSPPNIADATISPPSLLNLLSHLPILHLSLLVSAARLETIYDATPTNFTLVHKQYTELLTRSKLQRSSSFSFTKAGGPLTGTGLTSWSKDTARAAWEDLAQWQLIVPHSGMVNAVGAGRLGDERLGGDGIRTKMFRVDVTLDEIAWAIKKKFGAASAGETLTKWCKEV
ncbi:uncharacterized protein Z519_07820 [Cladophialophora bantiana CBS 173.52]|uniref:Uncharacterized protein n=1 Tax=Cladophialophora bantiana (strain ATCC 10958 / CBS 173.52 / CDC B-1940 / NIH 8579) TaxID=1442370 RepID=A0A0D2HM22_CLAB1|nr:uncharacterized protein Z519_07820 [Cladophialophora bantiana CBS 173.52]KIW91850.1 hypothetical protein Z519_07820 [Cladophialophora bantiana CBS 173.52]